MNQPQQPPLGEIQKLWMAYDCANPQIRLQVLSEALKYEEGRRGN